MFNMDIRKLIDKFMDGTSSLDEERILADYFRQETDIPADLEPYRKMFAYFDGGMADGTLLKGDEVVENVDNSSVESRRGGITVYLRRILYIAASVAVLFIVAYNVIGGDDDKGNGKSIASVTPAASLAENTDTVNVAADSTRNIDGQQNETAPVSRTPRKYRYKPAPPEVLTAKLQTSELADSVDGTASRLAEAELRKVELEQQYMLNMIKAVNLIHSVDIAEVADEEVY